MYSLTFVLSLAGIAYFGWPGALAQSTSQAVATFDTGITGTITFENEGDEETQVGVDLSGLNATGSYPYGIYAGPCGSGGSVFLDLGANYGNLMPGTSGAVSTSYTDTQLQISDLSGKSVHIANANYAILACAVYVLKTISVKLIWK